MILLLRSPKVNRCPGKLDFMMKNRISITMHYKHIMAETPQKLLKLIYSLISYIAY